MPFRRSGQLSYSPFEIEVVSKVNACSLGIPSGLDTQLNRVPSGCHRYGDQETPVKLFAVHTDEVDLSGGIRGAYVAMWCVAASRCVDEYDIAGLAQLSPLDLHAPQPPPTSRARSARPWSATGLSTGTFSFVAARTIACSATAPLVFVLCTEHMFAPVADGTALPRWQKVRHFELVTLGRSRRLGSAPWARRLHGSVGRGVC